MKRHAYCYLVISSLCLILGGCAAPAAASLSVDTGMVGLWIFTEDSCTDTYAFRADGTFSSTSRDEALEGTYSSERLAMANSRIVRVMRVIAKDNLGKDCPGSSKDDSGKSDIRYIKFNSAGNEMKVCSSPFTDRCFGPLRRIGN